MNARTAVHASAEGWTEQLLREGYCIIPDALPPSTIAKLEADLDPVFDATPFGKGRFYGERTKRFGSLLKRSDLAPSLVLNPIVIAMVEKVLGPACDRIQLNVAQAIEIHPGEPRQLPHRDHDMWQGAKGDHEYLVNVIWPLTRFSEENGATLIYPRSHGPVGMSREDPASRLPRLVLRARPSAFSAPRRMVPARTSLPM